MITPYKVAEEALGISSNARGIGAMNSGVRPGPNMFDQGGTSKPGVNAQPYNNERLEQQTQLQNVLSSAPQAASDAAGNMRSQVSQQSDAENKAQLFAAQRMSEALYANESGGALMRLNAVMQSPEKNKFLNEIATGKAMAAGMNPDLGAEVATKNQYA
jgi:hypothetical protein